MKKYITTLIIALVAFSCDEVVLDPVVQLGAAPQITSPGAGSAFVFTEEIKDDALATFTWTAADFGYQAAITYNLEMDKARNNFSAPVTLATGNTLSSSDVTVGKINGILLIQGAPFDTDTELEFRVCASVSSAVETLCSETVTIAVRPFEAIVDYPLLTVPGDYQGWEPADEDYAVFSRQNNDVYEGFIFFGVDGAIYKYAQGGTWDNNWGDAEPDGILEPGGFGNDIPIESTSGLYLLRCDLNTLAHSNTKTDWGLVGDATPGGWDTDTEMIWDEDRGVLTVTADLQPGKLKFRANGDWDINFGDNGANGTLEFNGDDITIDNAGNYTIDLNLVAADYRYTLTQN